MSFVLVRNGSFTVVPAIPYRPAIPAYTSWEQTIATRVVPGTGTKGAWVTIATPPPPGGGTSDGSAHTVWDPDYPVDRPTTETYSVNTLVYHPAVPEVLASPSYRISAPPAGWTAFARSVRALAGNQGTAKFTVTPGSVGVVVGLAPYATPIAGYGHIPHGLLFTGNKVLNIKTGSQLTTYGNGDEFTITSKGGTVTFLKNAVSVGSETSTYDARPLFLTAALYSAQDALYNPSLTEVYGGRADMGIPAATMFARQGAKADAQMVAPLATMVAGSLANYAAMVIPAAAMYGAEGRTHADAAMTAPMPLLVAYAGTLPVVLRNFADMEAPPAAMTGSSLTGEIGSAFMTAKRATMRAADRPYADALMEGPVAFMNGYDEPKNQAFMFASMKAALPLSAVTELVAIMLDGVFAGATFTAIELLDAVMRETVTGTPSWATSQLLDAIMLAFVSTGGTFAVPGSDTETWSFNVDSGGSTSYTNYAFNSYAKIGGKFYGASESGLVELDGDTDAGAPIRAVVGLGKLDFGTRMRKTVSEVYLGMSAAGNLFVKVIAEGAEYLYKTQSFSDQLRQQRVKCGKGLEANYLTLEIYNEDGADFELDTVEFQVADKSRKTGR